MNYKIALIEGDGIGPEVIKQAVKVLKAAMKKHNHEIEFTKVLAGGVAIDKCGKTLPPETLEICKKSDAVLLGAVGGSKWDSQPLNNRPEKALLRLREAMGLYANLRPAKIYTELRDACPLKDEIVSGGFDIMIVRELTGGIYFGERGEEGTDKTKYAWDIEKYSYNEIFRVAKTAFDIAMLRNKKVTSIDKSNVLASSRLWREVVSEVSKEYPKVCLNHMYVDNAAMQLVRNPKQFDVILTTNMFGDILSDEASQITGSIGLLPSASLNEKGCGMYEPIHGSAPDIAGLNKANPIAAILSAAMMVKYSLGLEKCAEEIEKTVDSFLAKGYRTADIAKPNETFLGCEEAGDLIVKEFDFNE